MKIVEEYNNDAANTVIEITDATYMENYTIKIIFNDLSEKSVDFRPFLSKSLHPSISKYLDKNLFKNFEIKDGNLNWNDYDLIFPVYDLYEENI
jgi:Protein of unknown function (DUF2442)